MKRLMLEPDFDAWRLAARHALQTGFRPEELDLQDATVPTMLALSLDADDISAGTPHPRPHTSKAFLEAAQVVAAHRDPQRWNLLYRLLYRLQYDHNLLKNETDDDVAQLLRLEAQVRRDLHKMHAFVRFRKVLDASDPSERPIVLDVPLPANPDSNAHHLVLATPTPFGAVRTEIETCLPINTPAPEDCEHFIAWYEPEHRILPMAVPFFAERFAIMRWTILTPDAMVSWEPMEKRLQFSRGLPRESAPSDSELETLWRIHYASIYHPARRRRKPRGRDVLTMP